MDKVAVKKNTAVIHICTICGKHYATRDTLNAHCKNLHNLRISQLKATILCPLCEETVHTSDELDKHLSLEHNITVEHTELTFKTEEDFKTWKSEVEKETRSFYKCRSTKTRAKTRIAYYQCHRSGVYTPQLKKGSVRQRSLKLVGTNKINCVCPARIRTSTNKKGRVEVDYVSVHVGHECEVERMRLTPSERKSLVEKVMSGIPNQQILIDLRENCDTDTRISLTTNHDLHNIKSRIKSAPVVAKVKLEPEDAKDVDLLKTKQAEVLEKIEKLWEMTGSSNNLETVTFASEILSSAISAVRALEAFV